MSNIYELTASVGVPRIAAIEYPFGRTVGMPNDPGGQMGVMLSLLHGLAEMDTPGSVKHLPFEWPETPREVKRQSMKPPPIVGYLMSHPLQVRRFIRRDVPH